MTTTYTNTSCNSGNTVACSVSGEGLLHACISSYYYICTLFGILGSIINKYGGFNIYSERCRLYGTDLSHKSYIKQFWSVPLNIIHVEYI